MSNQKMLLGNQISKFIESDKFPFEFISKLAEKESWRKEIYRPVYHIHKWWAKRLGSVFRGIILGCLLTDNSNLEEEFYQTHNFNHVSIFDPFMGSGTTIGEAHKLGCIAIGRDINPIACESVRVALGKLNRRALQDAFAQLSDTVGQRIQKLYRTTDARGLPCDVLYFFWVKTLPCPSCTSPVDLFSTRVIARNAYPQLRPEIQVYCPGCSEIFAALSHGQMVQCPTCKLVFEAETGNAKGVNAICLACNHQFAVAKAIRTSEFPPEHRLYAKLVLTQQGEKQYLAATQADLKSYTDCSDYLQSEVGAGNIFLPQMRLYDGYNARQALNYNYTKWGDFFNQRQLLALGWLQNAIAALPDQNTRDAYYTLFSGVLEFNNLFATYKGEGTGAVRHLFSHHILKPERMPIEANLWGTPKSSGSFSSLFKTRLLRALDYRENPFEVTIANDSGKRFHSSQAFSGEVEINWSAQKELEPRKIYLSCGSSDKTELLANSIDFVITDPPFFNNVHYSELADFFFAWQSLRPHGFIAQNGTTRHPQEVQDVDEQAFARKLKAVFCECHRVLKPSGLMAFTYHHSRMEGWIALMSALWGADFSVVNAHPIKAEMSVATPKAQALEPIQIDIIFVCKKRSMDARTLQEPAQAFEQARTQAAMKLLRMTSFGLKLSNNDKKIILISQLMRQLSPVSSPEVAIQYFLDHKDLIEQATASLTAAASLLNGLDPDNRAASRVEQLSFSFMEDASLPPSTTEENFRRGGNEAIYGAIYPISDLWTDIDAE